MKKLLLIGLAAWLGACTPHPATSPVNTLQARSPAALSGAATAQALQQRYADTVANCGLASMPAFLCSGVLLRGTVYSPLYHVWDPSPGSVSSGGVSFSYLRSDAKFRELSVGTVDGFIVTPWLQATHQYHLQVQCAFPIDGYSDQRSERGCGPSTSYPGSSDLCHRQNIVTAAQWKVHFESIPASGRNRQLHQCAFSVRDSDESYAANNFYQSLAAQRAISSLAPNELRVQTWPAGIGATLPVEAFFYIQGSTAGLSSARNNQLDFYNSTRRAVPVIRLVLPTSTSASAQFTYNVGDQLVTVP